MSRRATDSVMHRVANVAGLLLIVVAVVLGQQALSEVKQQASTSLRQQHLLNAQQGQINSVVEQLAASQANQLANRTANVKTWCGAINHSRDYARRLRASAGETPYLLPDLDCRMLEMQTAQSAHPKVAHPKP